MTYVITIEDNAVRLRERPRAPKDAIWLDCAATYSYGASLRRKYAALLAAGDPALLARIERARQEDLDG